MSDGAKRYLAKCEAEKQPFDPVQNGRRHEGRILCREATKDRVGPSQCENKITEVEGKIAWDSSWDVDFEEMDKVHEKLEKSGYKIPSGGFDSTIPRSIRDPGTLTGGRQQNAPVPKTLKKAQT